MLFNSAAYLVFLPVVVAIYWFMPFRYRTAFLLAASYVFYMTWKPIYLVLIVALTAFNYFAGIAIEKQKAQRKLILIGSLAANILTLAYFKYAYFAIDAS
jgi:alginate O-acetyltransferase complex protein AlgI